MRSLIIAITIATALAVTAGVYKVSQAEPKQMYDVETMNTWSQWKQTHGRTYGTQSDESYRLSVFAKHHSDIKSANSNPNFTFKSALNKFSDMTSEEFKKTYLKYKNTFRLKKFESLKNNKMTTGASKDWTTEGAVTPVKDQGACGSCWAFSAVSAIESANFLQKSLKVVPTYSEQQLVDCTGKSFGNNGCNGGNTDNAFTYVIDFPLQTEDDYPYRGKEKTCRHGTGSGTVTDFTDVEQNSVSQLKAAINKQPVSIAVEAHRPVFQFYMGGVITSKSCGQKLNHGVVAVGYDKDFNGQEFFYVRNSWGEDWGENGYLKISTSSDNICGILSNPSYPTA